MKPSEMIRDAERGLERARGRMLGAEWEALKLCVEVARWQSEESYELTPAGIELRAYQEELGR